MKITVNRPALLAALKSTVPAADARATLPALSCVRLTVAGRKLSIAATDLTVLAVAELMCAGDDGVVLVGAQALLKAVDRMTGEQVTLTSSAANLEIASGRSRVVEPTLKAADAPKIHQPPDELASVSASSLAEVLEACAPAICHDETRFHLNGVLLEYARGSIRGASTDGHRAHLRAISSECGLVASPAIVPGRAIPLLLRLLGEAEADGAEVSLAGHRHLWVRVRGVTFATKLIEAQFPPIAQVIPETPLAVTLPKAPLVAAIRRASLASDDSRALSLDLVDGELVVAAADGDRSTRDVLELTVVGRGALAHGIAPRYALEALQAVPGDDVSIYGCDPLAPILFAAPGAAPTYAAGSVAVVMPMRR